jgi:hypothetical protein
MFRPIRLLILTGLLVAAVMPSVAHGKAQIGISDNKPNMFSDPDFKALGTKNVRVVIRWDILSAKDESASFERTRLSAWMAGAKAGKYNVLLAFDSPRSVKKKKPTPKQLVSSLKKLRTKYPGLIKRVSPWNEANLSQSNPTKTSKQAAAWYKAVKKACKGCKIVTDVVDKPNLVKWTKKYKKALGKTKIKIWGLHNYVDVNNLQTKRTKAFLKQTKKGDVWLTETGGVVGRNTNNNSHFAGSGQTFAAKATTFLFDKIVKPNKRIKLVYIYNWNNDQAFDYLTWDSALKDNLGVLRPAYAIVKANK